MKHPRLKLILALIFTAAAFTLFGALHLRVLVEEERVEAQKTAELHLRGIMRMVRTLMDRQDASMESFQKMVLQAAETAAAAHAESVKKEGDAAVGDYGYGAVVKITEEEKLLPEGWTLPRQFLETLEYRPDSDYLFTESVSNKDHYLSYARISGPYYFLVRGTLTGEEERATGLDIMTFMRGTESVFRENLLVFLEISGKLETLYAPEALGRKAGAEAWGITVDMIGEKPVVLEVAGKKYSLLLRRFAGGGIVLGSLLSYDSIDRGAVARSLIFIWFGAMFCLALIVWVISVIGQIRRYQLTEEVMERYSRSRMLGVCIAVGLIGMAAVFGGGIFVQSLSNLFREKDRDERALEQIAVMADENEAYTEASALFRHNIQIRSLQIVADLLTRFPEYETKEWLGRFSERIGADYIMIFDEEGRETLSNSDYVNLTLGRGGSSPTGKFRFLLNGMPSLALGPVYLEETGLTHELTGVRLASPDGSGTYRALTAAFKEPKGQYTVNLSEIMRAFSDTDHIAFAVRKEGTEENAEASTITASSDPEFVGRSPTDLGMREEVVRDGLLDFFKLDFTKYFGASALHGNEIFFYAAKNHSLYRGLMADGLRTSLMYAVVLFLLIALLLKGYNKESVAKYAGNEVPGEDGDVYVTSPEGKRKRSIDPAYRWRQLLAFWNRREPEAKAWTVFEVSLLAFLIAVFKTLIVDTGSRNKSVIFSILSGDWSRGVNIFAFTGIAILVAAGIFIVLALQALIRMLVNLLGTKGETIVRLVLSLLEYVLVITIVFLSLSYLGVNTSALLTSVGILSLAVSLGAKDLIADVLAGITIVFEGEYQVGDIIEIDGFRGTVQEIGVRSTKLLGGGGNIKIIGNNDVKNVVNMTRMASWCSLELKVWSTESLEEIEAMLAEELPALKNKIPDIKSGPFYKGILSISGGTMSLLILAECSEENVHGVKRRLHRELLLIFEQHDIQLL